MRKKFDRIVIPLPKTGEEFLDLALAKSKLGTIIHLYSFLDEKDFDIEVKKIKNICLGLGHKVRVLRKVKCGQFSPGMFRVCFDLKVLS
jgi:tRNA G37 N-methylase Trm5